MSETRNKNINVVESTSCKDCCIEDTNFTSLLFFFLLLVCIFNKYDCGVSQDTLLLFFLLLVVLMKDCYC